MLVRNWIIYIISVISLVVFMLMYYKYSGFIVLVLAAAVPLIYSVVVFVASRGKLRVSFGQNVLSAERNMRIKVPVVVENLSALNQGSRAVVHIVFKNGVGAELRRIRRKIYLNSEREEILIDFLPNHSGINEIFIDKIRVLNGFSLFYAHVRVKAGISFFVMPEYHEFAIEPVLHFEEKEGDGDRFSTIKAGSDPSELFDIRNYRQGDKMNRINWKYSAKNHTLMVQDYGFPIACDTAVFVDTGGEKDPDKIERVMEILYYLTVKLTSVRKMFYVIWEDCREQVVRRRMILEQGDIYDLFMEIFRSGMSSGQTPIEDIYELQYEGEFLTGGILLCAGRGDLEKEIVRRKLRADTLELVCV